MTTTAEKTISMVNMLSEAENVSVQNYIQRLLAARKRKREVVMKPMTRAEIVTLLNESAAEAERGEVISWGDLQRKTAQRYGF